MNDLPPLHREFSSITDYRLVRRGSSSHHEVDWLEEIQYPFQMTFPPPIYVLQQVYALSKLNPSIYSNRIHDCNILFLIFRRLHLQGQMNYNLIMTEGDYLLRKLWRI